MQIRVSADCEVPDADDLIPQMRIFLEKHRGAYDGFIGFDTTASLAIGILQELGVRIPDDVAVVGSGNGMLATYGAVRITSVSAGDEVSGSALFDLLMDRIQGRDIPQFRRLKNSAKLVVRKSTQVE